jgi:predicted AlkP superfamily pyrophosphatase or phosphodiesterase
LFFGHDLPAAVANLASMLPSVPNSFGRLSEAYLSAFLALDGKPNPLSIPPRQSYAVVLVDGLGVANIKSAAGHAGFLNQKLNNSKSLFSGFPTTTATSLASFATGKESGEHAFIGYRIFDRKASKAINLLNDLGNENLPAKYQDLETISQQAVTSGKRVVTVGPGEYSASGFTQATMPAAKYLTAKTIEERFEITRSELAKPGALVYLYIPELDQLAHRFGSQSQRWLNVIESLDSAMSQFTKSLPKGSGAILTADHGVIDVPQTSHVYLDDYESVNGLSMIGGDPRVAFLYFDQGTDLQSKRQSIESELGAHVDVTTVQELVEAGWYQPLSAAATRVAPDLVLLPKGNRVVYHRGFAKVKSMAMIGQHGGMSKAEWEIPLLVF